MTMGAAIDLKLIKDYNTIQTRWSCSNKVVVVNAYVSMCLCESVSELFKRMLALVHKVYT